MTTSQFAAKLFRPKRPEPSYPRLPQVDAQGQTTVPGIYAVGEVAGTPLIKLGLNSGHELAERLAKDLEGEGPCPDGAYDFVILGAGAAGLGAAVRGVELGLKVVVLEANHLAQTVYDMTKGKVIFAEPDSASSLSSMWFEECTREELLEKWGAQVEELGLDVRTFEKVEGIQRDGALLSVVSTNGAYKARRCILAAGKAGNPRKAGVPGEVEYADRIGHRLIDPDEFEGRDILIYGGGDVALEAAMSLCDQNRVTLVTIDEEFTYPKKRNVDALREKRASGQVEVSMNSVLKSVGAKDVTFAVGGPNGETKSIPNDYVFEMIGAELPRSFFAKIGVGLEHTWNLRRWIVLFAIFLFVYSLYSLKSYGKGAVAEPFESLIAPEAYDNGLRVLFEIGFFPFAWMFTPEALLDVLGDRGYQAGYLYSLLYTVIMVVFGWQAMIRWRSHARSKRYQTWRYVSLIAFQVGFFLLVNIVAVQALTTKYAWRAWGLYQPFPLFFNVFFWWEDGDTTTQMAFSYEGVMWFFITAGVVGTLVIIPLLSYRHGKRFCTWVCGCGGLAETLGDRWEDDAECSVESDDAIGDVQLFLAGIVRQAGDHLKRSNRADVRVGKERNRAQWHAEFVEDVDRRRKAQARVGVGSHEDQAPEVVGGKTADGGTRRKGWAQVTALEVAPDTARSVFPPQRVVVVQVVQPSPRARHSGRWSGHGAGVHERHARDVVCLRAERGRGLLADDVAARELGRVQLGFQSGSRGGPHDSLPTVVRCSSGRREHHRCGGETSLAGQVWTQWRRRQLADEIGATYGQAGGHADSLNLGVGWAEQNGDAQQVE